MVDMNNEDIRRVIACPTESTPLRQPHDRCRHCTQDCMVCSAVFDAIRRENQLANSLRHDDAATHYRLWLEMRAAIVRTLTDLAPHPRTPAPDSPADGYTCGWNDCVEEIERRVRELQSAL